MTTTIRTMAIDDKTKNSGIDIGIIGAGNLGQSLLGYLTKQEFNVLIYDSNPIIKHELEHSGSITYEGAFNYSLAIDHQFVDDVQELIEKCSIIIICVPAIYHREVAEEIASYLTDHRILLQPGQTFGALEVYTTILNYNPTVLQFKRTMVAETQNVMFAARILEPGRVHIYAIKPFLPIAAYPSAVLDEIFSDLIDIFPFAIKSETTLETGLNNMNAILHPALTLANMNRIETSEPFTIYYQGVTRGVANIITSVDNERLTVGKALGLELGTALDWLEHAYGTKWDDIYTALTSNSAYQNIMGPTSNTTRYIWEDVPTGLVPIADLGCVLNVPTPTIDTLIHYASVYFDHDFMAHGRTLGRMGIDVSDKTPEEIVAQF